MELQNLYKEAENLLGTSQKLFFRKYFILIATTYVYFIGLFVLALIFGVVGAFVILAKAVYFGSIILSIGLYILYDLFRLVFKRSKPQDTGTCVDRKRYPNFDKALSDIEKSLEIKVKKVVIDRTLNASANSSPYFLFFGQRNVLTVGSLLLLSMSPEQVKWILAHELGHMSRKHGFISSWSYRTYYSLLYLYDQMGRRGKTHIFIQPFFTKVWPRLSSMQFALSKKFEFDVDKDASVIAGAESGVNALLNLYYQSKVSEIFFTDIYKTSKDNSQIPSHIYTKYSEFLSTNKIYQEGLDKLSEDLNIKSDYLNTHPCIKDRISAILGFVPEKEDLIKRIKPTKVSAYHGYFNDVDLLDTVSIGWSESCAELWKSYHDEYKKLDQYKAEYIETKEIAKLAKIAVIQFNLNDHSSSKESIEEILKIDSTNLTALILKLRNAIKERQEAEAEVLAEQIYTSHPLEKRVALGLLIELYRQLGDDARIKQIEILLEEFYKQYNDYFVKTNTLNKKENIFIRSEIKQEEINLINESAKDFKIIKKIYIVDRKIDILGIERQLLICIVPFAFALNQTKRLNKAMDAVLLKMSQSESNYLFRSVAVPVSGRKFSWLKKEFKTDSFQSVYKNPRLALLEPLYTILAFTGIISLAFVIPLLLYMQESGDGFGKIMSGNYMSGGKVGAYTDPLTKLQITIPDDGDGWDINSSPTNPGWTILTLRKTLTKGDLDELSKNSLFPDQVKSAKNIGFIQIFFSQKKPRTDLEKEWFKNSDTVRYFHERSGLAGDDNSDISQIINDDIENTDFLGYKAVTSTMTYLNSKYGTSGTSKVTTFIVDGTGYIITYSAPKPLYDKYLPVAEQIINSIKINQVK